ncbi:MAG TPA: CGNR zinc finger domain-containing protein [Pilimelia sp.]|nr:CGNR zinc finger domain-containing protein [Pilimelia sp.]
MSVPVPAPLRLVESFLNSVDVASGRDELGSVPSFHGWLAIHQREASTTLGEDERQLAEEFRDALRAELRRQPGADRHDPARRNAQVRLDALAFRIPLRARVTAEGPWLAPAADGVIGLLGEVLAAVVLASHDGTLRRLKICRAERCQAAYYDWSKNGSRCWCSMQTCGNRNKTKAYRGRRREAGRVARDSHSGSFIPSWVASKPNDL